MLMILARLVRSESFWAVAKVRSPHTGPGIRYIIQLAGGQRWGPRLGRVEAEGRRRGCCVRTPRVVACTFSVPRGSREVSHLFLRNFCWSVRKRVSARKEISGGSVGLFVEEFFSDYGTRGVLSEGSVSVYPSHARKVLQQRRGQAARPQLVPLSIGVPAVVKHRRSGREQQEQHGLVGREFAPCKY